MRAGIGGMARQMAGHNKQTRRVINIRFGMTTSFILAKRWSRLGLHLYLVALFTGCFCVGYLD
jgi:hypothetical protein